VQAGRIINIDNADGSGPALRPCPAQQSTPNVIALSVEGYRPVSTHLSGLMQIYQESRGELLRFLTARVGDRAEAEDLLHDLWLRIQSADAGPVANGRSYLYRAAQNIVLDRARARQRRLVRETAWSGFDTDRASTEPVDTRADIEAEIAAREDAAALAAAIAKLPDKAGLVFRLHKIDGLAHAEIAARLGISRSGVEKHIATAMTHLRRALDGGTT